MAIPRKPNPLDLLALEVLRDVAVAERGWRRRGVRGWMFYEEVRSTLGRQIAEVLPRLARRGWAERVEAAEKGRGRSVSLYRITDAGLRALATLVGGGYRPIPAPLPDDPEAGSMYLPSRAWVALTVLREAEKSAAPLRFGEPGWLTAREISARSDVLLPQELDRLREHGLVERRDHTYPGARGPIRTYRITTRGKSAELVDSLPRSGYGGVGMVQVKLGSAGPKRRKKR